MAKPVLRRLVLRGSTSCYILHSFAIPLDSQLVTAGVLSLRKERTAPTLWRLETLHMLQNGYPAYFAKKRSDYTKYYSEGGFGVAYMHVENRGCSSYMLLPRYVLSA